jgi:formylglycine-generating enzyme required for sulfatase activity
MRWIPSGTFAMGSEDFYPEERPVHHVSVDGFWIDETPITATRFRRFIHETKYVTLAERPLDPTVYPNADPKVLVPGSLVFRRTAGPVDLNDHRNWWEYVPGAYWKTRRARRSRPSFSTTPRAASMSRPASATTGPRARTIA